MCHLFEHIIIRSYLQQFNDLGYSRAFFGWLNGQTYESTIFFNLATHNKTLAELFEKVIQSEIEFTDTIIRQSIQHIEAEMESIITIKDMRLLKTQLSQIRDSINKKPINKDTSKETAIKIVRKPKKFDEIVLVIEVCDATEDEKKAFSLMANEVLDITRDAALDMLSIYSTGRCPLFVRENNIGIAQRFTAIKGLDIDNIANQTEKYLHEYTMSPKDIMCLKNRAVYMQNTPYYQSNPISIYTEVGIKISPCDYTTFITPEYLTAVLQKVEVTIRPFMKSMQKVPWD